jgi:hypothetical protein
MTFATVPVRNEHLGPAEAARLLAGGWHSSEEDA